MTSNLYTQVLLIQGLSAGECPHGERSIRTALQDVRTQRSLQVLSDEIGAMAGLHGEIGRTSTACTRDQRMQSQCCDKLHANANTIRPVGLSGFIRMVRGIHDFWFQHANQAPDQGGR